MPLYRIILGHLFSWAGRGLGLIARYPLQAACIAAALVMAVQCHGWRTAADKRGKELTAERLGRASDQAAYRAAQAQAAASAIKARADTEARYQSMATRIDQNAQADLADARTRADAYARRMRAHPGAAGGASAACAAAAPEPAESADRPGTDAVILGRSDFDVMVENTMRLKAAHDWAMELGR